MLYGFGHILDRNNRLFVGLDDISSLVNVMNRLTQPEQKGSIRASEEN